MYTGAEPNWNKMCFIEMQALHCLQRGHEVQKLLTSKTAMLENLQHILCQIQMAETNGLVRLYYIHCCRTHNAVILAAGAGGIPKRGRGIEGHAAI